MLARVMQEMFKMLKRTLPGPYTFILPATNEVPRIFLEHKAHKKTWKRREIGVRIPESPILQAIVSELERFVLVRFHTCWMVLAHASLCSVLYLGSPLLCSSVPIALDEDEEDDVWDSETPSTSVKVYNPGDIRKAFGHAVDFIVDVGAIESQGFSTVVDCMGPEPVVLRQGLGEPP